MDHWFAAATGTADVVETVKYAQQNNIPLAVKGGGHSIVSTAHCCGLFGANIHICVVLAADKYKECAFVTCGLPIPLYCPVVLHGEGAIYLTDLPASTIEAAFQDTAFYRFISCACIWLQGNLGLCNGGLTLDLSLLRSCYVDPDKKLAYVDGKSGWSSDAASDCSGCPCLTHCFINCSYVICQLCVCIHKYCQHCKGSATL